jgi:hypothetical protein
MNTKILYSIDCFCPKPYFTLPNGQFYFVLQFFLLNQDLGDVPALLDNILAGNIELAQLQPADQDLIFLPPPPNAALDLQYMGQSIAINKGFIFPSLAAKIEWIKDNYSFLTITPLKDFPVYLSDDQLSQLKNWLIGQATLFYNSTDNTGDARKIQDLFKPLGSLEQVVAKIKAIDNTVPGFKLAKDYLELPLADEGNKQPEFKFTQAALDKLKGNEADAKHFVNDEENFRAILYQTVKKEISQRGVGTGASVLKERMNFYFGMGERLRVDIPDGPSVMKIIDEDEKNIGGVIAGTSKIITNNYSLCGMVFSLPVTQLTDTATVRLQVTDIPSGSVLLSTNLPDLTESVKFFHRNVDAVTAENFQLDAVLHDEPERGPTIIADAALASYIPKQMQLRSSNRSIQLDIKTFHFFYVEPALLDALSSARRMNVTGEDRFLDFTPQRLFIRGQEVFKNDVTDFKDFTELDVFGLLRAIELDVTIQQTFLPQKDNFVCKLFKKADTGQADEERATVFNLLRDEAFPTGTDRPDNDIILLLRVAGQNDFSPISVFYKTMDDGQSFGWDADELIECYFESQAIDFSKGSVQAELLIALKSQLDAPAGTRPPVDKFFRHGFNTLLSTNPDEQKFLALDHVYEFKFNRSVNALKSIVRLGISTKNYTPPFPAPGADPLLIDFSNFNKLRLFLKDSTGKNLLLNNADALVPFAETPPGTMAQNLDMNCFYQLTHRFDNEVASENKDNEEQVLNIKAEENIYTLYSASSRDFTLSGKGENLYAYRKNAGQSTVRLPYSQPLKNLAEAVVHEKNDTGEQKVNWQGMLEYQFTVNATGQQVHRLAFNKTYFDISKAPLPGAPADNEGKKVARYRNIYQNILDAYNSTLTVVAETWVFDNLLQKTNPIQAADAGHPEKSDQHPSVMNNLRLAKADKKPLSQADKDLLFKGLTGIGSFQEFRDLIDLHDFAGNTLTIDLGNLTQPEFTVVRVGLQIDRADGDTVNFHFDGKPITSGMILPTEPGKNDQGIQQSPDKYERFDKAAAALTSNLEKKDDNVLYHKRAHLISSEHRSSAKKYVANIFGETMPYALICPQVQAARPNVLYYIPYGFRSLKVPSDFDNSGNTYLDFIEYVIRIIDYLAYPEFATCDVRQFLIDIPEEMNKQKLFKNKAAIRRLNAKLAASLAALITFVDNRPLNSQDLNYSKVIERNATDPQLQSSIESVVSSILTENPLTYLDCKAIGIGLFDQLQQDLYLLETRKMISNTNTDEHQSEEQSAVNFKGFFKTAKNTFFAEVLQNAIYDNEFEIRDLPSGLPAVKAKKLLDVVEGDEYTAQIRIPHFCPDWTLQQPGELKKEFYLLPSRKAPVIPVPVVPEVHLIKRTFEAGDMEWKHLVKDKISGTIMVRVGKEEIPFQSKQDLMPALIDLDVEGFSQNDQFLSTYDFVLQKDEEHEFNNDSYEIEVVENTESEVNSQTDADNTTKRQKYALQEQFERFVLKKESTANITWDSVITELDEIIGGLLPQDGSEDPASSNPVYRLSFSGVPGSLQAHLRLGDRGKVNLQPHRVIAAEIFEPVNPDNKQLLMVRIKVFATPWTKCRLRLRVRRNMRDLDGDKRFDINPALVINSPWSSWIDYNWQYLSFDYLDMLRTQLDSTMPQPVELPEVLRKLRTTETYASYRQKIRAGEPIKLGDNIISAHNLQVGEVIENRRFLCLIYELSGANGLNIYSGAKTDAHIIQEHLEKLNFNGKAWLEGTDLTQLDQLPSNINSFEPVYDIIWYSDRDGGVPVFGLKLKLTLTSD